MNNPVFCSKSKVKGFRLCQGVTLRREAVRGCNCLRRQFFKQKLLNDATRQQEAGKRNSSTKRCSRMQLFNKNLRKEKELFNKTLPKDATLQQEVALRCNSL
jgi:hypothetical protein